jgi:AcrR family transcriptional regulator
MEKTEKIRKAYIDHLLEHGYAPATLYAFAKKIKMPESELYDFYSSFEEIEKDIWLGFFQQARNTTEADETYQGYSVREKTLAFYYTWVEVLKANRSFVVTAYKKLQKPILTQRPIEIESFKEAFYGYANELLAEGRESNEILMRPFISKKYPDALWANTLYILDFWTKDSSKSFERTDVVIEKTINTAIDLMGRSVVDSVFDLAKFVFQNR